MAISKSGDLSIHGFRLAAAGSCWVKRRVTGQRRNTTVPKILHCGKNKITESVPVHGFGVGPNKTKAKSVAIHMAHGFANAVAAARAAKLQCPTEECPKMIRPQVVNEKSTELLTVILQANLYSFSVENQLRHSNFLSVKPLT